jgi:demethylmenaquinone methyltransferase / 2-methoxy-6-polyprenyl-1,4-benzoquinol methylase
MPSPKGRIPALLESEDLRVERKSPFRVGDWNRYRRDAADTARGPGLRHGRILVGTGCLCRHVQKLARHVPSGQVAAAGDRLADRRPPAMGRTSICHACAMSGDDPGRIFTGIGASYDHVATILSLGQDPRWRRTLVEAIDARPSDRVLDVATGTGMVAQALHARCGCSVVGLDQSADMLSLARTRDGVYETIVEGRAEALPFPDATFDHLTFTYLLRYVDDPAATMRELARVVKPGGRVAMVEFGLPGGLWRPLWWLYTRIGLPIAGRLVSAKWSAVGAFLGPSIERFYARHPLSAVEGYWREAGLVDVRTRRMSLGGGVVMSATKLEQPVAAATTSPTPASLAPAFYAARGGGWRDYWTLLHPPYTVWHLSYVLLGAALAPSPDPKVVGGALVAFGLGVGVAAHAFDELNGRPLRTRIPSPVLVGLGAVALLVAVAIGLVGATMFGPLFLLFVVGGAAVVVLYGFEAPLVHSDAGFALGWGSFPVVATAYASGAHVVPTVLAALAAALLSIAQRRLSTRARSIRRRTVAISGEIVYADGARESIDATSLIGAVDGALSILWLAVFTISLAVLLARWL